MRLTAGGGPVELQDARLRVAQRAQQGAPAAIMKLLSVDLFRVLATA